MSLLRQGHTEREVGQFRAGSKRGRADEVRDICHFRFCLNNGEMDVSNAGYTEGENVYVRTTKNKKYKRRWSRGRIGFFLRSQ